MKNISVKIICLLSFIIISISNVMAYDVLVLPTDIFNVCDNYFCFPEASTILADSVIKKLNNYRYINSIDLSTVRNTLYHNPRLKESTQVMLRDYANNEKIDFNILKVLSEEFNSKSILLINSEVTTEKTNAKRNIWEILEISNAFNLNYPFKLNTSAVLLDNVNSVVMWSNKYSKTLNNNEGNFESKNHIQATSQLEKIKQYYQNVIAENICQNVNLRFFPKTIRTFDTKSKIEQKDLPPNASEFFRQEEVLKNNNDKSLEPNFDDNDLLFSF